VVRVTPIDNIIEFALEELLSGSDGRRRAMVRRMCEVWPDVPALSIVFAVTSAAARFEDNFSRGSDTERLAAFAYRLAALLAADVYAVESMGHRPAKANDLLHFWRRVDPWFLEL
jgi:hypothetical protein